MRVFVPKNVPTKTSVNELAIYGGTPVYSNVWPQWPRAGMFAQRAILDVLHSDRWSISARTKREKSYERLFGYQFAKYIGRSYAVPCSSGSAALRISLQALGICPGDEIIVPGLTWVAVASSVVHLGAIPVLADIGMDSFCITAETIKPLISTKTRAVIAAHMYSSRADMKDITDLCRKHSLLLIEDASQAHGACLNNTKVGNFGDISVFSFQQTKLLTSGEGGIALTDDLRLYERLQQLRSDGRVYKEQKKSPYNELTPVGDVLGSNFCMSEFHAAILTEGLKRLDHENIHRRSSKKYLKTQLSEVSDVYIRQDDLPLEEGRTCYKIPITFEGEDYKLIGPERLAKMLSTELNLLIEPLDKPLDRNKLFCQDSFGFSKEYSPTKCMLPRAHEAWSTSVCLPHFCLLGINEDVDIIVHAIKKVQTHSNILAQLIRANNEPEYV